MRKSIQVFMLGGLMCLASSCFMLLSMEMERAVDRKIDAGIDRELRRLGIPTPSAKFETVGLGGTCLKCGKEFTARPDKEGNLTLTPLCPECQKRH